MDICELISDCSFARSEVTCGNGEDDVSLVSDPTNGQRILDNVDTTILSVIKVVE